MVGDAGLMSALRVVLDFPNVCGMLEDLIWSDSLGRFVDERGAAGDEGEGKDMAEEQCLTGASIIIGGRILVSTIKDGKAWGERSAR